MPRPAKEGVCEEADRSGGRALLIRALNIMVVLPLPAAECRAAVPLVVLAFWSEGFRIFGIQKISVSFVSTGLLILILDPKGFRIFRMKKEFIS